jgi:hypothetical protein
LTELEDFVGPPSVYELSDERSYNLTAADEECLTLEFLINIYNREKKNVDCDITKYTFPMSGRIQNI